MTRLRIPYPEHAPFKTAIEVRVTDLNYGGHLGNDRLLALLHEARVRFLATFGICETGNDDFPGIILLDASLAFASEAFLGETLDIAIAVEEPGNRSFALVYGVKRADGGLVATARTSCVFFDYSLRKIAAMPAKIAAQWHTSTETQA